MYNKLEQFQNKIKMSMEKEKNSKTKEKNDEVNIKEMIIEKYNQILKKEESKYINEIIESYETLRFKLQNEIEELELNNEDTHHKNIILKNLNTYYKDIYEWDKIPYVSEYERPKSLCFHRITLTPMMKLKRHIEFLQMN